MAFAFAVSNGAGPAIRSFSSTNHLDASAWPVALVSMALLEVVIRVVIVQLRGRRLTSEDSSRGHHDRRGSVTPLAPLVRSGPSW